jgi:hypothetical protein
MFTLTFVFPNTRVFRYRENYGVLSSAHNVLLIDGKQQVRVVRAVWPERATIFFCSLLSALCVSLVTSFANKISHASTSHLPRPFTAHVAHVMRTAHLHMMHAHSHLPFAHADTPRARLNTRRSPHLPK